MTDARTDRRKLIERGPDTFLDGIDCRYKATRLLKEKYEALVADLGGPDELSYQETVIARRVIHLEAVIEDFEQGRLDGEQRLEWSAYFSSVNTMTGLLKALGLKRRIRSAKTLQDHIGAAT